MPIAPLRSLSRRRRTAGAWVALALLSLGCMGERPPPDDQAIDLTAPEVSVEPRLPAPSPKPKWCPKEDGACSAAVARGGAEENAGDRTPEDNAENHEPLDESRRYDVRLAPDDPVKGPALAPVTLVVFSDFQCPFCKRFALILAELQLQYPTQIRVVWKDLPLPGHAYAGPAALLAREAYARGGSRLFWQVHDMLFTRQEALDDATLQRIAASFELPWPPSERYQAFLDKTYQQVLALNVRSTPTTFVNGTPVIGVQSLDVFERAIDAELQRVRAGVVHP